MKIFPAISLFILMAALGGCGTVTRTETDVYTITMRDTTVKSAVRNTPGDRDNGVIFPSSKTVEVNRDLLQYDSLVVREYPAFIRLGLFESVGLAGTSSSDRGLGSGLFGLFYDKEQLFQNLSGYLDTSARDRSVFFSGGLYRLGIGEWRLRLFRDRISDLTWGFHGFEAIIPSVRSEEWLVGVMTPYIRKRWFLREEIPYIAITGAFGGAFAPISPSTYVNMSASLDVGSIGGLNLRLYAGLASGSNAAKSPLVIATPKERDGNSSTIPYVGIGMSTLDFLNLVRETEREWKDMEHSSWDIGVAQVALISATGVDKSIFSGKDSEKSPLLTGVMVRLANASIALPVLDYKLYAGTSLMNVLVLGQEKWGMGILPLRVGYWQTVVEDELSTEPFIEYNYYPSNFIHLGNRLNLKISNSANISLLLGYASGSGIDIDERYTRDFGNPTSFSSGYIGISIGINDRIFYPEELRYNRVKQ